MAMSSHELAVEHQSVVGEQQVARLVEIDGLGQENARAGEGDVACLVIEPQRIFQSPQAYPQQPCISLIQRQVDQPVIQRGGPVIHVPGFPENDLAGEQNPGIEAVGGVQSDLDGVEGPIPTVAVEAICARLETRQAGEAMDLQSFTLQPVPERCPLDFIGGHGIGCQDPE
jgi:hypothetical protein